MTSLLNNGIYTMFRALFILKCRFVELLWQLSVHALREVHQRTFADDVSSNSLPPVLTEASYQNAAALLPVTKVIP